MTDDDAPTGEELVADQQPPNRYAVPLSVLVAGAAVPLAEQTTEQPLDGGGPVVAGPGVGVAGYPGVDGDAD
jgi:hypothetical protein